MLFEVYERNKNNFDKFYIFGFDGENDSSKEFLGSFNHNSLIEKLSAIYNPILILHPSDTQMAKSGSPMKLFEYASLNLPMVVGNSIQQQASKLNGVVFYQSGNSEDLLNTLTSVTKDYQSYYQQSQKLRQSVMENYTWSKIVADWLKNLDK
jgi:glycosyltransferase involved in cell wall biosynthesis